MIEQNDVAEPPTQIAPPGERGAARYRQQDAATAQTSLTPASRRHGWFWRLTYSVGWLTALTLVVLAALRIFEHDGNYTLTWFNAFTRYLYLPAYATFAWAAWQRRWLLATVSLVVVACHLRWMAPDFVRDSRFDVAPANAAADAAPSSKAVRIFYANVCADNEDPAAYLDEIALWDPDIVVFVEFYYGWHGVVATHPAMHRFKYGTGLTMPFVTEVGVFSKLPIDKPKQMWTASRLNLSFDLLLDDQRLHFFCLHSPRPMEMRESDWIPHGDPPEYDYQGFWKKTIPQILRQPDPLVVLGDFNATQYSAVYQTLTADHLRSAHEDAGRGYATTWPNGEYPLPPIRIDQALLSPGVECVQITEGEGRGSDHKPLIVDVRIRPGAGKTKQASQSATGDN